MFKFFVTLTWGKKINKIALDMDSREFWKIKY